MQMRWCWSIVAVIGIASIAIAEPGDDSFSAGILAYVQTDGEGHLGGNPKIDEDEFVFEAVIFVDKSLSDQDRLNVKLVGDIISSASQTRPWNPQYQALQSGASGNKRIATDIGYSHKFETFTLGVHGGFGAEYNSYYSWPYGVNVQVPLMADNTVLGFRLDGYTDYFIFKYFDGTQYRYAVRQTASAETNLMQVLTPKDLINLNLGYTFQSGSLETSYYSVYINDVEFAEQMPSDRHRGSLSARWKHSLSNINAFEIGYRFYADTWNILSHTAETKFFQYVYKKMVLLEPHIRFYTQTGTYFFGRYFTTSPRYRTSDTDLGPFTGAIFGLKSSLVTPPFFPRWFDSLSLGGNYWLRDDGFRIYWFDMTFSGRF